MADLVTGPVAAIAKGLLVSGLSDAEQIREAAVLFAVLTRAVQADVLPAELVELERARVSLDGIIRSGPVWTEARLSRVRSIASALVRDLGTTADQRATVVPAVESFHAFLSYLRDDSPAIDKVVSGLGRRGVSCWVDKHRIEPGVRWQDAIRHAIQAGRYFIACFSTSYHRKDKSYMNEELFQAIEQLRQMPRTRKWFLPCKIEPCEIPDLPIGAGETLRSIQYVNLAGDLEAGLDAIAAVVSPPLTLADVQAIKAKKGFYSGGEARSIDA